MVVVVVVVGGGEEAGDLATLTKTVAFLAFSRGLCSGPRLWSPPHAQLPLRARGLGGAEVASHNQRLAKGKEPVGCLTQGPAWG